MASNKIKDSELPVAATTDAASILNSQEFVEFENVPVFVEHERKLPTGQTLSFGRKELQKVVDRSNKRIEETADFCPIVIGHTNRDPRAPKPPKIGWAGPFRLGWLNKDKKKLAVLCDFRIEQDKACLLKEYPRRSAELWSAGGNYDEMYFDPISLLGAETPWSDMGILLYQKEEDGEKIWYAAEAPSAFNVFVPGSKNTKEKYSMESDEIKLSSDQQAFAQTILNAIFQSPEFKFLQQLREERAAEKEGGPGEEVAGGVEDEPLGDVGGPAVPEMGVAEDEVAEFDSPEEGGIDGVAAEAGFSEEVGGEPAEDVEADADEGGEDTFEEDSLEEDFDEGAEPEGLEENLGDDLDGEIDESDFDGLDDLEDEPAVENGVDGAISEPDVEEAEIEEDYLDETDDADGEDYDFEDDELEDDDFEESDFDDDDEDGFDDEEYEDSNYLDERGGNDSMSIERLARENAELKERLARLEKFVVNERGRNVDVQRYSKLESLSQRYYFDKDEEFEKCKYQKMKDAEFDEHCARIEKNYRSRPDYIDVPNEIIGGAGYSRNVPGAVQYSKEQAIDIERKFMEAAESNARRGVYERAEVLRDRIMQDVLGK
jgi:hypothetical protein